MKIFNRKIFNEERFYEFINELVELRGESDEIIKNEIYNKTCLLYTSPSPRDRG